MRGLIPLLMALGCSDSSRSPNQSIGTTGVSSATTSGGTTAGSTTSGTGNTGGTTAGPNAMSCTPFASWCENDMLLTCTRSGMDATGYDCSRSNSTINGNSYTYHCATQCPNQPSTFGPCCNVTVTQGGTTGGGMPTGPVRCNVALSAPTAISGNNNTLASEYYCSAPSKPDCPNYGTFDMRFSDSPKTCPPNTTGWSVDLTIYRATVMPGATVSAASTGVSIDYRDVAHSTNNCTSWTGTVTFTSDAPVWSVSLDVTCAANTSIKIKGTFNGDVT